MQCGPAVASSVLAAWNFSGYMLVFFFKQRETETLKRSDHLLEGKRSWQ
jgi:hypothetical protein